jgi:hypothetical protein
MFPMIANCSSVGRLKVLDAVVGSTVKDLEAVLRIV